MDSNDWHVALDALKAHPTLLGITCLVCVMFAVRLAYGWLTLPFALGRIADALEDANRAAKDELRRQRDAEESHRKRQAPVVGWQERRS